MRPRGGAAYVALALLTGFWGYSWVAVRVATRDASPWHVAAMRAVLGAATLFAYAAATRRPLTPPPVTATVVYALLQTAGFTLLQTIAVSLMSAGKAAILTYTMPFWTVILSRIFLRERLTRARAVALCLAGVGLAMLVLPLRAGALVANVVATCAGLVWAMSALWVTRVRAFAGRDIVSVTAWQMAFGAILLVAAAALVPGHVRWTGAFLASLAFLAVIATGVCWALWLFVLSRFPPATAGIAMLGTPVVGTGIAALQLHEIPSALTAGGLALMVAALGVNVWSPRDRS